MTSPSKSRRKVSRAKSILAALDALAATLPSDEERDRAKAALDEVIGFLQSARVALEGLPTQGDVRPLQESIGHLNSLFERAMDSPALSAALGLEPARLPRTRVKAAQPAAPSAESLDRFRDLTIDQMRDLLTNENQFTISRLTELARVLGARVNARSGREALANQILTKITNLRGYQQLSSLAESAQEPLTQDE